MNAVTFARRSDRLELMDADESGGTELRDTFRQLAAINRLLGGDSTTLAGLARAVPAGTKRLRILDVGCGDGNAAELMLDWAQLRGIVAEVRGIDLSPSTIALAQERRRPGLSFACANLFDDEEREVYDVVHAGLMLHHCPGEVAVRALRAMFQKARLALVVNDLHRHAIAYYSIKFLTAALSRNPLIRNDAPLSVLRGFQRHEILTLCRAAGLPAPEIRWRWPFRWQVVLRR
jgi:2-polyprenyl-3-methyl-5-hydroxy-6-metoxy-1,4-benzoquinol methylase